MRTSRKLAHAMLALFALVVMSSFALAADPGLIYPPTSEASDQKAGSVLVYNVYTSGSLNGTTQNTRINITNTSTSTSARVHLFFVANGCSIADSDICLTPTQTGTFLASDVDPGFSGYIVAVAVDGNGCPKSFNFLIGDEYVKYTTGHAANLGAEAYAALFEGTVPGCDANSTTATINLNGVVGAGYNLGARVLADDFVASKASGNDTKIIINRIGGNLAVGANTLGTLFGLFYDDSENVLSFSISGSCQIENSLSNTFPRLTPRFETFIPAGRTGWFKVFSQSDFALSGAAINLSTFAGTDASAFSGGHNLHRLTLTAAGSFSVPVYPLGC